MIENLRATNSQGLSITFDESFRLTQGLDLSGLSAEINATQQNRAGSIYQSTRLNERNLDLEFQIRRELSEESIMDEKRALMYRVFTPEDPLITFDFNLTSGEEYYFTAHTVTAPLMPPGKTSNNSAYQLALVQMLCTDPYIYQRQSNYSDIATIDGGFMFPLEIPQGIGIEMGTRSENINVEVTNVGTSEIGMLIRFTALANVSNPSLTNLITLDTIKLNFDMQANDQIEVNTTAGRRSITLIRNDIRTNIFFSLDFAVSKFLQLPPGTSIFTFAADSGSTSLNVSVDYNVRYVGV